MAADREAHDAPASSADEGVARLIERWQAGHDPDVLATLVERIHLPLERILARVLARRGIRDPGARDDAWALVIEHLARLGQRAADSGPRHVGEFQAVRAASGTADAGWAYIRCLARSRAADVARVRKRQERWERRLADEATQGGRKPDWVDAGPGAFADEADETVQCARVLAAVAALDERSRIVVMLLLEGKSQAVVAHVLGVCEGTVSRIRARAIARLRALFAANTGRG